MAAAMEALEIEQRQLVVFHAWLLCTCRKWFDWEQIDVPPSAGCPVHGHVIMTRDGRAL